MDTSLPRPTEKAVEKTAYALPEPSYRSELTRVERGTPMGELLRRYWQPVGLAADAGLKPKQVRILGEDLILFRDGQGRPGLLYPRCCHRGTTLYYGRVEENGLRCCYHGWLFGVEGHCLDMPVEPDNGAGYRHNVRQPWYPLVERYGLIFAYLGPPERMPAPPRIQLLEELDEGENLVADDSGLGTGGEGIPPCNWLQHYENVMDPLHVVILHDSFSGTQFVKPMGIMPRVEFEEFAFGVRSYQYRDLADGKQLKRITEVALPNIRVVASPLLAPGRCGGVGWTLPVDSTHYRLYNVHRVKDADLGKRRGSLPGGKRWRDMTEEEHRDFPGDWEAQVGQGPITFHSEEHLAISDKGVRMLRKMLEAQLKHVAEGGDPIGVGPGADTLVTSQAGNWFEEAPSGK